MVAEKDTSVTIQQFLIFLPAAFLLGASPGANNLLAFISATKAGWFKNGKKASLAVSQLGRC